MKNPIIILLNHRLRKTMVFFVVLLKMKRVEEKGEQ